jgi:hypothetical protein
MKERNEEQLEDGPVESVWDCGECMGQPKYEDRVENEIGGSKGNGGKGTGETSEGMKE